MSNYTLSYSISKRTPASPKVLKEILDAQAAVNRVCTWSHEQLSLTAPRDMGRAVISFPFVRLGHLSAPAANFPDGFGAPSPAASADAFVQGSTKVRDSLWNAHLVAAFLKHVSRMQPELVFELRDEGGFVVPGSVWIRNGNVEANREYLNRERARALEVTGDPQAAGPYVWAELQALSGNHFVDGPASDYGQVPEIEALEAPWEVLEAISLSDVASRVVERAVQAATVPARA